MAEGKFIVLEGIDGSGISTQADLLRGWLQKRGLESYLTKEPTDGPVGAIIRLAIAKRLVYFDHASSVEGINPVTLALLFAADRIDHVETDILPKLALGVTVISDRYYISSYAYQGLDVDLDWLISVNQFARKPDLTILVDTPALLSRKRMERQRWHVELFEDAQKLEEVRQRYLSISKELALVGERIAIIDGANSVQEVHKRVAREVRALWGKQSSPALAQLSFSDSDQASRKEEALERHDPSK